MSIYFPSLLFTYDNDNGVLNVCLKFNYNNDGTASLINPKCKNHDVIFDQFVVRYLKKIELETSKYYFKLIGNIWFINHISTSDKPTGDNFSFLSGDMIYDDKKVICFNPIPLYPSSN